MRSLFLCLAFIASLLPGPSFAGGKIKAAVPFPGEEALLKPTVSAEPDYWRNTPSAAPDPDVSKLKIGEITMDSKDLMSKFSTGLDKASGKPAQCPQIVLNCQNVYPVMAMKSASGKIPVSVLKPEEVDVIFKEMASNPNIPFKYPEDGCFARAHVMAQLLEKKGIRTVKAYVEGDLHVDTKNSPKGFVEWSYHVAPAVAVQGADGKINMMIIDPAIFDHPVTMKEWTKIQTSHSGEPSKTYFTDRFNLSPMHDMEISEKDMRGHSWGGQDQKIVDSMIKNALVVQKARARGRPDPLIKGFNTPDDGDDQLGPPAGSDGGDNL